MMTPENLRIKENRERSKHWLRWGPYLSERQWGTVREDYTDHGHSWTAFPHDQARSRVYRWSEDGLNGWSDRRGRLCFAPALWNGQDPILKERLYGFGGHEGNHGEDCKECYYYLDSTPSHSYTKVLYKYPQCEYPYARLLEENSKLTRKDPEIELANLGVFDDDRYFDVVQEVAKRTPEDILWKITVTNRAPDEAPIHVLPMVWLRNIWEGGNKSEIPTEKPSMKLEDGVLKIQHETLGDFSFHVDCGDEGAMQRWLFTENDTNEEAIFARKSKNAYTKDAFHRYLIQQEKEVVNPEQKGTKAAPVYKFVIPAGESVSIRCRLHRVKEDNGFQAFEEFEETLAARVAEADQFYEEKIPKHLPVEEKLICRQSYAGLLWTKQFYHFVVKDWLHHSPDGSPLPKRRLEGRNHDWEHIYAQDVLSMPDKWEYPWFAAWDSAFHMISFATIDPDFAKDQLLLLTRGYYMHANGQLPAYEWNFSDVNPPVHAWAVWRVYKMGAPRGQRDKLFLEKAFQKLLINFTWWVNHKDSEGRHVFGGGFLGLDNIGVFDRSHALPDGSTLNQADGTAWMASYCLTMLSMALELAPNNPAYNDISHKFFEHFVNITDAINSIGGTGLWDETDGFYYDQLMINHDEPILLKTRSLVGLLPLFATMTLEDEVINKIPGFRERMDWFLKSRPDLQKYISSRTTVNREMGGLTLLSVASEDQLRRTLERMLDPDEFLSTFGIRSLSKAHEKEPFVFTYGGVTNEVSYTPAESETDMFGGNSNWRGPIWFPTNYLLIEALERYHFYYGDSFTVEYPQGSGKQCNLREVAHDICARLVKLFTPDENGRRPCFGDATRYAEKEHWNNLVLYHEYFNAETGEGLGASHQTGWTSLITHLIHKRDLENDESLGSAGSLQVGE
ncbi:MAG: glucosidase [Rubritalea sp.]